MSSPLPAVGSEAKRELLAQLLVERHRRQFPALLRKTYLNYGVQGPLPTPSREAIGRFFESLDEVVPTSLEGMLSVLGELDRTRRALASVLGAGAPDRIALLENTSTGCNVVLWGLPWRPGDRLLLGEHEYPPVVAAAAAASRRLGFEIDELPSGPEPARLLEELERRLRPRTRLVLLSHVSWEDGRLLPLPEIAEVCRRRGARLLVDGAQSAGLVPLSLASSGVDFYAFPSHKWLCGPEGLGGLYVDPEAGEDLSPTFLGPRSFRLDRPAGPPELHSDARRFEISTSAVALCAGLRASLDLHERWGTAEARWRRARGLGASLWRRLNALGSRVRVLQSSPPEAGLVFFRPAVRPRPDLEALVRSLDTKGVVVRTIPGRSCLRASVHYLTLEEDLETLIDALHSSWE